MYRLVTENINPEWIENLLVSEGMDFTSYPAHGSYEGKREGSLVIDLEHPEEKVMMIAKKIAALNHQDSVLVEHITTEYTFVKPEGL